ncbi:hypothetical protein GE061_004987 [Apolygus lucorum]|uniref:Uncharacterized protein n=1 Tax=Apolygus lucorum TaxID=248454 RepID=A0A8S9WWD5_APOLU|nr:hypothetical protein GE061_004987 [Apolygus lucorum]
MMVLESPLRLYTAAAAGLFPPHSIFPSAAHRFSLGGPFGSAGFLGAPPQAPGPPHIRFRPQEPVRRPPRRPTSPLSKELKGNTCQSRR